MRVRFLRPITPAMPRPAAPRHGATPSAMRREGRQSPRRRKPSSPLKIDQQAAQNRTAGNGDLERGEQQRAGTLRLIGSGPRDEALHTDRKRTEGKAPGGDGKTRNERRRTRNDQNGGRCRDESRRTSLPMPCFSRRGNRRKDCRKAANTINQKDEGNRLDARSVTSSRNGRT